MKLSRKWIVVIIAAVVFGAALFGFLRMRSSQQAAAQSAWQTEPAQVTNLVTTVGATGTVRSNQSTQLTWQTSGTVREVLAQVGENVSKDQELAVLAQDSLPQNVILAQADLASAQKALEDLKNSQVQAAQAQQAVEDAQKALEDLEKPQLTQAQALEAIATAQKAVEGAENQLRWSRSPADQTYIDQAKADVVILKDQLDRAQEKFTPYAGRPEDNLERARLQANLAAAQQRYDAAVRKLNSLLGTASETDQSVLEANVLKAKAQLEDAQRQWERLKNGPTEAELALAQATLADAQREWERLKDGPDPYDLTAAEARVSAAQAALNLQHVAAPFAGQITRVSVQPGDQVTPGSIAFRLDDLSHLLVDVQVSEVDINAIGIGQEATLTFDSIRGKEYHGKVTEVADVGEVNQGVVNFNVTMELTDADAQVKPGMTAAVTIVVGQLKDVLAVPNRAVRTADRDRVVYVLRDGQPAPVKIRLGQSSDTYSEVLGGELKAGDLIVLNPPSNFGQNGGMGGGPMGQSR